VTGTEAQLDPGVVMSGPLLDALSQLIVLPRPRPVERLARQPLDISLDEIKWTVGRNTDLDDLASKWGIAKATLVKFNPLLRGKSRVVEGTQLVVYRADLNKPSRSVGSPNHGRLLGGMPLPEGESWRLRSVRRRAFGTEQTVEALLSALTAYGEQFPQGPPIRIGELSRRRGGRISPHASHRTGRDVDIAYLLHQPYYRDRDFNWPAATEKTFDVEKTWFFIKSLLDTGKVQTIFVDRRVQKMMLKYARQHLSQDELARTFQYANDGRTRHPLIKTWKGHKNHMHVRFGCDPDDKRCRDS
jgi:murein endopeptidase